MLILYNVIGAKFGAILERKLKSIQITDNWRSLIYTCVQKFPMHVHTSQTKIAVPERNRMTKNPVRPLVHAIRYFLRSFSRPVGKFKSTRSMSDITNSKKKFVEITIQAVLRIMANATRSPVPALENFLRLSQHSELKSKSIDVMSEANKKKTEK